MRAWVRINLTRRASKQMRIRKEPNTINSVKHQTSQMNKRERIKHIVFLKTEEK
jgi:hypothetical protein